MLYFICLLRSPVIALAQQRKQHTDAAEKPVRVSIYIYIYMLQYMSYYYIEYRLKQTYSIVMNTPTLHEG